MPQVALAHVDCDFYDPTKLCLEKWYPALSPGGIMQFDDYNAFSGCRKAVDEFVAQRPGLKMEAGRRRRERVLLPQGRGKRVVRSGCHALARRQ